MPNTSDKTFYTTGQLAKMCNVTVRTLQYYDEKDLLHPTFRSEGGRRLYSDAALARLRTICLLKSSGLSLKGIHGVLEDPDDTCALLCLSHEQDKALKIDIDRNRAMLKAVQSTIANIQRSHYTPEEDNNGMEHEMDTKAGKDTKQIIEQKSSLYLIKRTIIFEGIIVDIVEVIVLARGIKTGEWTPLLYTLPLIAIICVEFCQKYFRVARYVCPHCHTTFQPSIGEMFWASHTPKTRKLTCPACGEKAWCAEISATYETSEQT